MTIRIVGLILTLCGCGLTAHTLIAGAVSTSIFLLVMVSLIMTVGGTILTSERFHLETKKENS